MRFGFGKMTATSVGAFLCLAFGLQQPLLADHVVINEFMALNTKTIQDEDFQFADWIELYNPFDSALNVGGYYMSDTSTEPMKWKIPTGTSIAAKGRLLIWADGTTPPNPARPLHASFKLNGSDGELLAVYAADGKTTQDAIRYGQQAPDVSFGRLSDNSPAWGPFKVATPRMPNKDYAPPPARLAGIVFINEWLTSNVTGIKSPMGKREDWLELYNSGDVPIDLGNYYLTDHLTEPNKFLIPLCNVIGPKGFALFWADNHKKYGPTHTNFKLSDVSGDVGIFEKDGVTRIDSITYGRQGADVSQGRKPDGSATIVFFTLSTPRATNVPRPTWVIPWIRYR